ncbi:MAG TPA: hypothetical protein VFU50_17315 [Terriglobales bacterium]|nr:hypothetical protein [Terriglobales bacterium]
MSTADTWKLLVFRDGRSVRSGPELLRGLLAQIEAVLSLTDFSNQIARDELIDALLRAGGLECALVDHDAGSMEAHVIAEAADQLASALLTKSRPHISAKLAATLGELQVPRSLTLSTPEGFCYYALHPLDYADLLAAEATCPPAAAVVGIRSIGTTLSAIVRAWFSAKGIGAARITVRPIGHPFERRLPVTQDERNWIAAQNGQNAHFFVVDEGPGLSGSSFLSVAEALVEEGVPAERIVLMPSSTPNLENLFAPNAAQRWKNFRTTPLKPTRYMPSQADEYIGGGAWRSRVFDSEADWPGVWPWTERQKYTSRNGTLLFRFDGHGHYGKAVRQRSQLLANHGWGPQISSGGDGFSVSAWLSGARLQCANREVVTHLARYCAFRSEHLTSPVASETELEHMAQINLERALGVSRQIKLPVERPVVADARMMPFEWIALNDGSLQKFDAADHGDNHFFPGPTDIAWDLAGAIVEWELNAEAADLLLSEYCRISGDEVQKRLPDYLIAYSSFRMAFAQSAANSIAEFGEKSRLRQEATRYTTAALKLLEGTAVAP